MTLETTEHWLDSWSPFHSSWSSVFLCFQSCKYNNYYHFLCFSRIFFLFCMYCWVLYCACGGTSWTFLGREVLLTQKHLNQLSSSLRLRGTPHERAYMLHQRPHNQQPQAQFLYTHVLYSILLYAQQPRSRAVLKKHAIFMRHFEIHGSTGKNSVVCFNRHRELLLCALPGHDVILRHEFTFKAW